MLCVIAWCAADKQRTIKLAEWIRDLGGVKAHDCLLIPALSTDADGVREPITEAFARVRIVRPDEDSNGWPNGANLMWKFACGQVADELPDAQQWLFMEPDAVPLVPEWMDKLEAEYKRGNQPFMAGKVQIEGHAPHNTGVSVYPKYVRNYTANLWQLVTEPKVLATDYAPIAWDVYFAKDFLPVTHHTKLFQDVYWQSPGKEAAWEAEDALSQLEPEAVIFHRNKDGKLIERLRERRDGGAHGAAREAQTGRCSLPIETRPVIHTYYDPVPEIDGEDAQKLISLWREEWEKAGYKTVVLGREDAMAHPKSEKLIEQFKKMPSINPAGYDLACYLRWLAMSQIGGWLSDYDVMPLRALPSSTGKGIQFFSGNDNDPVIPCLVYGSKADYAKVTDFLASHTHDGHHISDMIALRGWPKTHNHEVKEYGEPGWQDGVAVHFSNHSMQPAGKLPRWQHIPALLSQPKDKPPLTDKELVAELVARASVHFSAKGRITKLLRAGGFK
jgi:hypothetical protein